MKKVSNWKDIPEFDDEGDESDYWAAHELEQRLMNS
ncbi:MAG: hypothetical protein ACI9UA_006318, partial [Pseudoalteromonas tetraodonis]